MQRILVTARRLAAWTSRPLTRGPRLVVIWTVLIFGAIYALAGLTIASSAQGAAPIAETTIENPPSWGLAVLGFCIVAASAIWKSPWPQRGGGAPGVPPGGYELLHKRISECVKKTECERARKDCNRHICDLMEIQTLKILKKIDDSKLEG